VQNPKIPLLDLRGHFEAKEKGEKKGKKNTEMKGENTPEINFWLNRKCTSSYIGHDACTSWIDLCMLLLLMFFFFQDVTSVTGFLPLLPAIDLKVDYPQPSCTEQSPVLNFSLLKTDLSGIMA